MITQQMNEINHLLYNYRAVLFVLMCLACQLVGWRMWRRWVSGKTGRRIINFVFIVFNLAWFFMVGTVYFGSGLLGPELFAAGHYLGIGQNRSDLLWAWVGRPAISWQVAYIFVLCPLGVVGSILLGLVRRLKKNSAESENGSLDQSRRDFIKTASITGSLGILGVSGYGLFRQGSSPEINHLTINVPHLPLALNGFTIAHLTDIHLGLWASLSELEKAFMMIADAKPDMVALTGDLVDRRADYARLYLPPLQLLAKVPYGVWGVLGNHDHYTGAPEKVAGILRGGGINMLMDQQFNVEGLPLSIIGLDDQGAQHSWMGSGPPTVPGAKDDPDVLDLKIVSGPSPRPEDFVILLNHRPEGFRQAMRHGCHLYLAGHTHGGQYQVPFNNQINLSAAFYKYSSGLYHEHDGWLNVSRGLASVGIPFRLCAWPEISVIKLVKS